MSNVDRYRKAMQELSEMTENEMFELVTNAKSKKEQDFFIATHNCLIQQKQADLIKEKAY